MSDTNLLNKIFNTEFLEKIERKELSSTDLKDMTLEQVITTCLDDIPDGWEKSESGAKTTVSLDSVNDLLSLESYLDDCEMNMYNNPEGGYLLDLSVKDISKAYSINDILESQSNQSSESGEVAKTTEATKVADSNQSVESAKSVELAGAESTKSEEPVKPIELSEKNKELDLIQSLDQELSNKVKTFEGDSQVESITVPPSLTESKVKCFEEDGSYFVKLPIAMEGNWLHPNYGELSFSKDDLVSIKNNIDQNVLGWEPPVFYGHPTESGAGCEGYLINTRLEELDGKPILFGYWKVNKNAYTQVKEKRYRYSSSEFIENFNDLKDGKDLGTVLIGMALTNRPFMPDLPTNKALSIEEDKQNKIMFSYQIGIDSSSSPKSSENKKNPENQQETKENMEEVKELKQQLEGYQAELKNYSEQLETTKQELESVKTAYQEQLNAANEKIKSLSENARNFELERKLKRLEALTLPAETKERNRKLLQEGSLGNSEEEVLLSLEEMSKSYSTTVLDQHGVAGETQEEHQDTEKPSIYEDMIKRNLELAEKQKQKRYERAANNGYRV